MLTPLSGRCRLQGTLVRREVSTAWPLLAVAPVLFRCRPDPPGSLVLVFFSLCWPASHSTHTYISRTRGSVATSVSLTPCLCSLPPGLRDNTVENCLPPLVHGPMPPTRTSLFAVYDYYLLTQPHCDGCSVSLLLKCHRAAISLLPGRCPELHAALVSPERVLGYVSVALHWAPLLPHCRCPL